MKTLKWILGILQALAIGAIGKLLYDNFDTILLYFLAYPTNVILTTFALILVVLVICFFEIYFTRKINLRNSFEVSKPVKKLTPVDFHITKYIEFYINRESDKDIEDLLSQGKYIFITGIPMLGKTRMAYEATKKLNGFYLLKPKYETIDIKKLKLPLFKKKIVLFLDDIDKYVGKFSIDALIRKIKEKAKDFVVITTCRSGKEFEQVFAEKEMENLLTQCLNKKIEPRLLEKNEPKDLATEAKKDLNQIAFDGTPGSITIDLRYMKQRYEQLNEEKTILKCMKLLKNGNIFLWKENLLKQISKEIFNLSIERTKWDDYIKSLLSNGFIKKSSDRINISHDVYLDDRFLDDYIEPDRDLIQLKNVLYEQKDAENLFYLGNAFYQKKNIDEAFECYQKSIQMHPDEAGSHCNLGVLLKGLKRFKEAEEEYRSALRINPDSDVVHTNLGNLLKELERSKEAEEEYRSALRINPDYADAHYNLGNLLYELERFKEAEEEYRSALRINPEYTEAHGNLGNLLKKLKRKEEARKDFEIARDLFRKQGREDYARKVEEFLKDMIS